MRLLKESVLQIWKARKTTVREEIATSERAAKAIQDKLDRLGEAFLFELDRHRDIPPRRETARRVHARSDRASLWPARRTRRGRHPGVRRTDSAAGADQWVQASLDQRQRFQQLCFPNGIAFDGNRFIGTGATALAFSYLREIETKNEGLVAHIFTSWNPLTGWIRRIGEYRAAA
jgi:hypothetical protein